MATTSRPMVRIHDTSTDEVTDREMNDKENADYQTQQAANAKSELEAQAEAQAKAALLSKLGITEEEAKLLLS